MNLVTFIILTLGFTYAVLLARRYHLPLMTSVVSIFLLSAQYVLVEQRISGVPARLIATILSLTLLSVALLKRRLVIRAPQNERLYVRFWLLFMGAGFFSLTANGSIESFEALLNFAGRYGFALLAFFLLVGLARRPSGAFMLIGWLFLIASANFFFALAQYLRVDAAFAIHDSLFPFSQEREQELKSLGQITSFGYLPGLSTYSINTGYILACFGLLGTGLALHFKSRLIKILTLLLVVAVTIVGSSLILSRSSIIFSSVVLLPLWFILLRRQARLIFSFILFGTLVAWLLFSNIAFNAFIGTMPQASHLNTLADAHRPQLFLDGLAVFINHPIFGNFKQAIASGDINMGLHNFLINSLVIFGLVGTIPMLIFIGVSLHVCYRAVVACYAYRSNYIIAMSSFGAMLVYLLKSLVHNESVVTSGILYSILVAITLGAANESTSSVHRSTVLAQNQ